MEEPCYSKYFERYMNIYCIFDEDPGDLQVEFSSAVVFVVCLLFLIFDYVLLKQAKRQALLIVSPAPFRRNDNTYCILSLYMVKLSLPWLVSHAIYLSLILFQIAVGKWYINFGYEQGQIDCKDNLTAVRNKPVIVLGWLTYDALGFLALTILMLQIYEWGAMLYLVKS